MHRKENIHPNQNKQRNSSHLSKNDLNKSNNILLQSQSHHNRQSQKSASHILAQMKQSKQFHATKKSSKHDTSSISNKITQRTTVNVQPKTSFSMTRNNFKPKFILKELMQQENSMQQKQKIYIQLTKQEQRYRYSHIQNQHKSMMLRRKDLSNQLQRSECQQYFKTISQENDDNYDDDQDQSHHHTQGNISYTFTNSPINSEAYYNFKKFPPVSNSSLENNKRNHQNKSAIITRRSLYQQDDTIGSRQSRQRQRPQMRKQQQRTQQEKYQRETKDKRKYVDQFQRQTSINQQKTTISSQINKKNKQLLKDQIIDVSESSNRIEDQQQEQQSCGSQLFSHCQQQDTLQIHPYANNRNVPRNKQLKSKENRYYHQRQRQGQIINNGLSSQNLHSQSTTLRSRSITVTEVNKAVRNSQPDYKLLYLSTVKKLQIRTAYFNQAIKLTKHVLTGVHQALEDESQFIKQQEQTSSKLVDWCVVRCGQVLQVLSQYITNSNQDL